MRYKLTQQNISCQVLVVIYCVNSCVHYCAPPKWPPYHIRSTLSGQHLTPSVNWVKQENICLTSACTHPSFIHHMVCILFSALKSTSNICCWNNFTDTGVHLPPPTHPSILALRWVDISRSVHRCEENDHVTKPGSDSLLGLLLLFAHCLSNGFGFKSLCLHLSFGLFP